MAIQEQTGLTAVPDARRPAVPATGAEWTAKPLRPVARWIQVSGPDGAAHLQMVWSVPDPQTADLY